MEQKITQFDQARQKEHRNKKLLNSFANHLLIMILEEKMKHLIFRFLKLKIMIENYPNQIIKFRKYKQLFKVGYKLFQLIILKY